MKVFISWSGGRSRETAELLCDWIKCVIQAAKPWISTRDIDRGALWFSEISDQLKDTSVGIVCITQNNKNNPWILFEAGALAKGLSSNKVCTFLVDLMPADIEDPLAQFNHTLPDKEGLWALIRTLNNCLGTECLDERILDQVFNTYWVQFEKKFEQVLSATPKTDKTEVRSEKNLLAEILENTRFLSHKIRSIEHRIEREPQGWWNENFTTTAPSSLTPRQKEVFDLILTEKSYEEIAEILKLSLYTVRAHAAAIFQLLGLSSRVELKSKYGSTLNG